MAYLRGNLRGSIRDLLRRRGWDSLGLCLFDKIMKKFEPLLFTFLPTLHCQESNTLVFVRDHKYRGLEPRSGKNHKSFNFLNTL